MKAIVCKKYGPPKVLQLEEVEKPIPGDDELLVEVYASSINSADHRMMRAKPFFVRLMGDGFLGPKKKIPGIDMAGRVVRIGKNVETFKVGDEVYGDVDKSRTGAFAEYVCVSENSDIVVKPKGVSYDHAGATPVAGITALQALRDHGHISAGDKVLINGASGSVGTFAVILAKAYGALVTGVCSTRNLPLVKDIGADRVIDYTREDFRDKGERYDLILDIAANIKAEDYIELLNPKGTGILIGLSTIGHMMGMMSKSKRVSAKNDINVFVMGSAKTSKEGLITLIELIEAGKITPVIDRIYPLEKTKEAMRYFDQEHARAKVVIKVRSREV